MPKFMTTVTWSATKCIEAPTGAQAIDTLIRMQAEGDGGADGSDCDLEVASSAFRPLSAEAEAVTAAWNAPMEGEED